MKQLIVKTGNREMLDRTLLPLGGLVGKDAMPDGLYVVRAVSGDVGFLKFAIASQGYAEVIREEEV